MISMCWHTKRLWNFARTTSFVLVFAVIFALLSGCASTGKDGVSTMDVTERQSANYGSGDKSQDRSADSNNINLFKMKTSF